jgi:hypothetical protein
MSFGAASTEARFSASDVTDSETVFSSLLEYLLINYLLTARTLLINIQIHMKTQAVCKLMCRSYKLMSSVICPDES